MGPLSFTAICIVASLKLFIKLSKTVILNLLRLKDHFVNFVSALLCLYCVVYPWAHSLLVSNVPSLPH